MSERLELAFKRSLSLGLSIEKVKISRAREEIHQLYYLLHVKVSRIYHSPPLVRMLVMMHTS